MINWFSTTDTKIGRYATETDDLSEVSECVFISLSLFLFCLFFHGKISNLPDMVVSGVPQENGINHAGEIASMALDLVSVCHTFKIPHKPNTQLKIRAGIHSGTVDISSASSISLLVYPTTYCVYHVQIELRFSFKKTHLKVEGSSVTEHLLVASQKL